MNAPEVLVQHPQHPQTPFSSPACDLLWTPLPSSPSHPSSPAVKPVLTLSSADYTSLQTYITTTTPLPHSYEAYKTLYPDVLSPLTSTNLYSRTGQTLVSTAGLTRSYQLSFSEISSIAGAIIGFATEARMWYPRLQTQLRGLDNSRGSGNAGGGGDWEGTKNAAITVLKILSGLAERKEERIGVVLAQFTSLRTETLHQKSTIQGITQELSDLQESITRALADQAVTLQALNIQRASVEEERSERNRERNRALIGLTYMFVDPLVGLLTTAAKVSEIQSVYESKRRERNSLDDQIDASHNALAGLEKAKSTTSSLENTLGGILSVVDAFLQVCASIKETFRTMQTNFELVSAALNSSCDGAGGGGFAWAVEDLQRAQEVWERIAERAYEFQSEEFLKLCMMEKGL
ncbi:hypothetical protein L873DRAFT_1806635 [Choiromyces venosus 120613-1]|uniref:Uncharacterized protein n=1 Tax=Choiromyces venosus 120613-1 TaxID=1336337 RepID=A0A3N4JRH3_9PEZI|nr:hypothetical protein L873DRAFT_1806635 [Choiromyces venosus 120613-1]